MKKYIEILKKSSLFRDIDDNDLLPMLSCLGTETKKYEKKETVIYEGEPAKYIGLVLSGSVQITSTDYFGNRSIVGIVMPSEIFGEAFACAGVSEIPVDVIAAEDSEILFIDSRRITLQCSSSCDFHRQLIYNLMKVIATKNLMFHKKIEITSKKTTREKLMAFLDQEAKRKASSSFDIPYDRQELADYLGVERSGLSSEIGKLSREGIIRCHRKHFELFEAHESTV